AGRPASHADRPEAATCGRRPRADRPAPAERRAGRSLGRRPPSRRGEPRRARPPRSAPMTAFISDGRRWRIIMVLALGSATSLARADMIVTEGMQPWETCAECHNLDGISVMARFPKLAGQRPDYIAKQVRDFRDGRRRNDGGQMAAIAAE